jgi:hypothetical protein
LGDVIQENSEIIDSWVDITPGTPGPSATPTPNATDDPNQPSQPDATQEPEQIVIDTSPNVLPIDFDALAASIGDSKTLRNLYNMLQSMPATNKNEYTGMFEGYNLIYLTAEGFSPYAVDENLTPTLYKLIHSGFVFENYYVPLWQTSTSDGEYVNNTALIPDQQFSMRRSADIAIPFTLPAFFAKEGVNSYAYHNNSLSYYDRHRSHTNLGYNFKATKLGDLDESEYGGQLFEMDGISEEQAREAMRLASHKLPVKCKFMVKDAE